MSEQTFIIVGASLAGASAAAELREQGFEGRVVLIGSEPQRPYQRPPLSKDYLRGDAGLDKVYLHDESFYADHDIELRTSTTVERIEPPSSEVVCDGGERLRYDRLLLTTGAQARHLSIPGAELQGVHYLRSLPESDRLRERLGRGGSLVVVGAGWIGCEVAAAARQMGLEVTVVEPASLPLEHVLGPEAGAIYRDIHTSHGVKMLLGTGVESFEGSTAVDRVHTTDGRVIDCDFVVVGVGATPNVGLAAACGITVDGGIVCDEFLQTSLEGVFAAGDVARSGSCASSTGPPRSTRARRRRATCSAGPIPTTRCSTTRSPMTRSLTSTPTSTTSAWSTAVTPSPGTRWSFAATSRPASSSPSGARTSASWPA
jgi:3-phenylpropionate/trans-cinnamate dioxygenase ferredoxin reductase component